MFLLTKQHTLFEFHLFIHYCPFSVSGSNLRYHTAVNYHVSLVSSGLFLSFLVFHDLDSHMYWSGNLQNVPQSGYLWCFSHDSIVFMGFCEEYHRADVSSSHDVQRYKIPTWQLIGDINLQYLVKVQFYRFGEYTESYYHASNVKNNSFIRKVHLYTCLAVNTPLFSNSWQPLVCFSLLEFFFAFTGMLYEWHHTICSLLSLASFT